MWLNAIYEGIVQAVKELSSNKLRSFLSSLGITIGIFCIISVLSAVDSLENSINQSFEKLGNDVLWVDKNPWNEDPNQNWWKYRKNPKPDYSDFEVVDERVTGADFSSFMVFIPGKTITYRSSNVRGAYMCGITYDFWEIISFDFESGRYFTPFEYARGLNTVILGNVLAKELFQEVEPVGKIVKIGGRKYTVIGVLEKEGNSLIPILPFDEAVLIGINTAKEIVNIKTGATWGTLLNLKARPGVELVDLKDEVTGVLRAHRKIRPKEDSNFYVNEMSIFTNLLKPIFSVLNSVGFVIGIFAIIVGIFSVANIMFVSVKERTNIIGIKKSLGAKDWIILFEFLIEAILLCIVGGVIGLLIVIGVMEVLTRAINFEMFVSTNNIIIALAGAVVIGILAGLIPAIQAARMDPVEAMRK